MLRWAMGFLVLALIAAFFGFGGIAVASAGIAKTSTNPQGLESLLKFYTSPEARKTIEATGLEPVAASR